MSFPDSPQVKFILGWDQAFLKKDLDSLAKHLHKDYFQITYPRSLNEPDQNKEQFLAFIAKLFPLWTETKSTIHSVIDTPGKVITHFTFEAKTTIGTTNIYEAITISHIITDEDGSLKLIKTEEFADSKVWLEFKQALAATQAK